MASALPAAAVPNRADPVPLTRLALENFRSYASAELRPSAGLTVVAAPNGAGKTNLLEAIHTAITGRSQRATLEHELVRHGSEFGRVVVEIAGGTAAGGATIELVLPGPAAPPGIRKRLTVNGVARRPSSVGETARAVFFRPEEMLLLVGSPSERRRFLDGILVQRDRRVGRDMAELGRVLAQRNALLRAIRAEEASLDSLGFWDEQLAQVSARVMVARLELVRELGERIGPLHAAVAPPGEGSGALRLGYLDTLKDSWPQRSPPHERLPDAAELVGAFRTRISDTRPKEAWNGVSLVGPQRDDLRVELEGREVAAHASRGQQRTIILALKLAETDILADDGPHPIVLLDDVFSELDPKRATRLGALLLERGQVVVTTTDASLPGPAGAAADAVWRIVDGRLVPPGRIA